MIIQDIYDRSRFFLNDMNSILFTDAIMLLAVKAANDELSDELITNGIPVQKQVQVNILVTAGTVLLTLPTDFIAPIRLWERAEGSNEDYVPMIRTNWPISKPQGTVLGVWNWRNQKINLSGATVNREVRLDYTRALVSITSSGSALEVIGSLNYLSYKCSALAVESIGGNQMEADRFHAFAQKHLDKLLKIGVRNNQSILIRRRPFRLSGIRRFF